jgi:hypothetical protein
MAIPVGDEIEIYRGDTFIYAFARLGPITNWTKIWFTVKDDKDDNDAAAIMQLVESNPGVGTDGLLAIAGGAPAAVGNGSITITSVPLGTGSIRVEALETAKLVNNGNYYYDFQYKTATDTLTLLRGRATILGDATRTV